MSVENSALRKAMAQSYAANPQAWEKAGTTPNKILEQRRYVQRQKSLQQAAPIVPLSFDVGTQRPEYLFKTPSTNSQIQEKNVLEKIGQGMYNQAVDQQGIVNWDYKNKSVLNRAIDYGFQGDWNRAGQIISQNPERFVGNLAVEVPINIIPVGLPLKVAKYAPKIANTAQKAGKVFMKELSQEAPTETGSYLDNVFDAIGNKLNPPKPKYTPDKTPEIAGMKSDLNPSGKVDLAKLPKYDKAGAERTFKALDDAGVTGFTGKSGKYTSDEIIKAEKEIARATDDFERAGAPMTPKFQNYMKELDNQFYGGLGNYQKGGWRVVPAPVAITAKSEKSNTQAQKNVKKPKSVWEDDGKSVMGALQSDIDRWGSLF